MNKALELVDVFCDGAMRALAAHIADRSLKLSEAELDHVLACLRVTILTEYDAFMAVAPDALGMGGTIQRALLNVHCNAAATGALKQAGYL